MLNLNNLTMNLSESSNYNTKIDNYNDYNINHYDSNYNMNKSEDNNIDDLDNINIDDIENLDNLDNLDCSKFFSDIYNNIMTNGDTIRLSKCSRCDSDDFIEDYTNGIIICTCGQVINNLFDTTNDVRQYEDDNKQENKRYNKVTNELLPQSSLGAKLPYNIKGNLHKIQSWSAMPYKERSLNNDFKIINSVCEKLNLSKNIQNSANIYYAAAKSCKHQEGDNEGKNIITRGKNNKGIQGGCIWISCKKYNIPVLSKDIAENFNLTIKELNKGIKSLKRLLEIKNMSVQLNVIGSEEYVRKYCTSLNVKTEYMDQAIQIAKNIDKLNIITEHTQFSIAATSVLIMAELNSITNVTKKSLKEMFGVSNVTISKTYKKLEKIKHILIDDNKVNKLVDKIKTLNEEQELTNDIKIRMEKFNINLKHNEKITNKQIDDSDLESNKSEKSDDNKKLKIIVKNKKDIKMPLKKINKK
jgi:transcription initiation factor TFIIIB Brf1 subunit/transcription initiation factor TFIIB